MCQLIDVGRIPKTDLKQESSKSGEGNPDNEEQEVNVRNQLHRCRARRSKDKYKSRHEIRHEQEHAHVTRAGQVTIFVK